MHSQKEEQLRFLLALLRMPGIGPVKLSEILNDCPDLTRLFDASGFCEIAKGSANWALVDQDLAWADLPGCLLPSRWSPSFPEAGT